RRLRRELPQLRHKRGLRDFGAREIELYRRPFADLALYVHVSAGLLDEAVKLAQSEPGPLSHRLCSEERLEHPRESLLAHAVSGIANGHEDIFARLELRVTGGKGLVELRLARFDGELATLRHRVAGVGCEIKENAL